MSFEERQIFEDYVNLRHQYMNLDVDPSIDFVEYACGKYPDNESSLNKTEERMELIVFLDAMMFMLDDDTITNSLLKKVRDFRSSRDVLLQNGMKGFLKSDEFINSCGGIPAFNDNWNVENFNWAKAVGILNSLGFFSLFYPDVKYMIDDGKLVKIIVLRQIYINTSLDGDLDECLEMLELDTEKLEDVVNDMNLVKEGYRNAEVGVESGTWFWRDLKGFELFDLKVFLEAAGFTLHDYDAIAFEEGIIERFAILNSFDPKILANYLGIYAVYEHDYLYKPTALCNFFTYFKPAIICAGFEIYYNDVEKEKLQKMVDLFEESFERIKNDFPPDIYETRYYLFGTDLHLLHEDLVNIYSHARIHKEYENLQISPDDFFQNITNIRNNGELDSFTHYFCPQENDNEKTISLQNLFTYVVEHYQMPLTYYFTKSLPFLFWNLAIHAISEFDRDAPQILRRENYKFKIHEDILKSQIEQREDWIERFDPKDVTENLELLTYSYRDYENWMEKNEATVKWQNEILSKINLDCRKFFFVNFALEYKKYSPKLGTGISTFMNFPAFIKSFKFAPCSPMNPRGFMFIN